MGRRIVVVARQAGDDLAHRMATLIMVQSISAAFCAKANDDMQSA